MSQRPLYDHAAEQSILGALLLDNNALDRIDDSLAEADFYGRAHAEIYRRLRGLIVANQRADVVTLASALAADRMLEEVGGIEYLGELIANVPSAVTIANYARIVVDRRLERELVKVSYEIQDLANGVGPVDARMEQAQRLIFSLTESVAVGEAAPVGDLIPELLQEVERRQEADDPIIGLRTGLADLDRKLCGLQDGDLIIVAGRPSMGKTTLAMQFAKHAAVDLKLPVAVFSMEMGRQQLMQKLVSNIGRIDLEQIRTGKLDEFGWSMLTAATGQLSQAPLYIDDKAGLTVDRIRARARRIKRRHGLRLVVVDYLQLIPGSGDNRNEEVSTITRGLKLMARELECPVLLLSQLSRKCEERTNKRPQMSDLRDSGAIEQDADVILFIYRDEVYNDESPDKGIAEINIAKHRMGETGMVAATAMLQHSLFANTEWRRAKPMRPPPSNREKVFGE